MEILLECPPSAITPLLLAHPFQPFHEHCLDARLVQSALLQLGSQVHHTQLFHLPGFGVSGHFI